MPEHTVIDDLAEKYGKSKYQIILNWGLCRGCSVIPKSERLVNQRANMECTGFKLSQEEVDVITKTCDKHQILLDGSVFNGYSLFA